MTLKNNLQFHPLTKDTWLDFAVNNLIQHHITHILPLSLLSTIVISRWMDVLKEIKVSVD